MKKLYKFYVDFGRMGDLDGLFIAEEKDVKELMRKEVCFGEVLGKHSDVSVVMTRKMLKVVDIPDEALKLLEEHLGETLSGYNPFEYRTENDE